MTVVAVGDIACRPGQPTTPLTCQQAATAGLAEQLHPSAVLALGDEQYQSGSLAGFDDSYAKSWGHLRSITHPVPGNHEYADGKASGYYSYFGPAAGQPGKGYYSFDLGSWHLVALNAECGFVGGCGPTDPETRWLRADLAAHPAACTLAYWHQPRFSSALHGADPTYASWWGVLQAAGAELVLSGHDHDYERFAPQDAAGQADPAHGIVQFVVGTGGRDIYPFLQVAPNSVIRRAGLFGVLELTLAPGSYRWRFVTLSGATLDSGSATCH